MRIPLTLVQLVAAAAVAVLLAGCGNDNDTKAQDEFLQGMIPHHQSAVQMADIALQRSQRPEIRQLAQEIKRDQEREIEQMHRLLGNKGAATTSAGHGGMGAGGPMDDVERLKTAEPFDRAFIDAMIPHHESAISAAKDVKGKAKSQEVKDLADAIVTAQEREIAQMRDWRRQWFGA